MKSRRNRVKSLSLIKMPAIDAPIGTENEGRSGVSSTRPHSYSWGYSAKVDSVATEMTTIRGQIVPV